MVLLNITGTQLKVTGAKQSDLDIIYEFINKKLTTYTMPKGKSRRRDIDAIYALSQTDHILMHANVAEDLAIALMTYGIPYKIVNHIPHTPKYVDYALQDHIKPRPYQVPAIDFLTSSLGGTSKLLGFSPGAGKTISFLCYLAKVKHMCCGVMKPGYAAQWAKVIPKVTNITADEILVITGSSDIVAAQQQLLDNTFTAKIVLISNKTMQKYLKSYRSSTKYLMSPAEFMEKLGVGTLLIDEVHEDLHFNYLLMSSVAVSKVIGLSGTFVSRDSKIMKIQGYMFKAEDIYDLLASNPYISYIEANYSYPYGANPVISERGMTSYSHVRYEKWILENKQYLLQFLATVIKIVDVAYVKRRLPGEKILIYAMRSDMVLAIQDALELAVPNDLKISTYMEGDPYDTLLNSDIIVSTPIKSGAAVDIPNLTTVLSTYITASIQRLIQMLGRLRPIDERETIYVQLVAASIQKQSNYQFMNRDIVDQRVAKYNVMQLGEFSRKLPQHLRSNTN